MTEESNGSGRNAVQILTNQEIHERPGVVGRGDFTRIVFGKVGEVRETVRHDNLQKELSLIGLMKDAHRRDAGVRQSGTAARPRCRREKRARGEPIFARKTPVAAGQNRGAPAILDGRQSPRRHAMAMLISLSHRDEREITVLPPNPIWAFGVNRKTPCPLRPVFAHSMRQNSDWKRGALAASSSALPAPKTDPLPEPVSRPVARCIARARDGDGGGVQECRRPNARNFAPAGARPERARGTECGNLTGPLIMLEFGMCVAQWFVRKTCASF